MPTYDYICRSCKEQFEIFQSIKEDHLTKCPRCNRNRLQRLVGTGAGIIFKGSGFYATDYKKSSEKSKEASADVSKGEGSSGGTEAKTTAEKESKNTADKSGHAKTKSSAKT